MSEYSTINSEVVETKLQAILDDLKNDGKESRNPVDIVKERFISVFDIHQPLSYRSNT